MSNRLFLITTLVAAMVLAAAVRTMLGQVAPVDQRLALQIAGLSLQVANLSHDLEMCKSKEAAPKP